VPTQEQLLEQIATANNRIAQAMRYRLAHLSRRLHQQGTHRAALVLRRRIGRGQQRLDEAGYRLREAWRAMLVAAARRAELPAKLDIAGPDVLSYGEMMREFLGQLASGGAAPAALEEGPHGPTSIFHQHRLDYDRIRHVRQLGDDMIQVVRAVGSKRGAAARRKEAVRERSGT